MCFDFLDAVLYTLKVERSALRFKPLGKRDLWLEKHLLKHLQIGRSCGFSVVPIATHIYVDGPECPTPTAFLILQSTKRRLPQSLISRPVNANQTAEEADVVDGERVLNLALNSIFVFFLL